MNNLDIQFAKPADITQIITFAYQSLKENDLDKLTGFSDNFEKATLYLTNAVTNEVVLVKRNATTPSLIDGVVVLAYKDSWWSSDTILASVLFFVRQEHRTFKVAKDLLNAAKEYAILNNLPLVFELFGQKDAQKKKNLLKYLGFKELGSYYVFNV